MLPGKTYTVADVVTLVRRRAWLVILLLIVGIGGAAGAYQRIPRWYQSETVIMLMPQRIPDSYVKAIATEKPVEDRLATLDDQIKSRSRLEHIIKEQSLYQDEIGKVPIETLVDRIRKQITVKIEGKDTFRVSFVGRDPMTVQRVTSRLTSLFIEENLRDREKLSRDTNDFLESQLQDARRRLVEHEKKLEAYRREHSGQLPTQAASNMQAIQNLQLQLQSITDATDRATERRLLLERQLADAESAAPAAVLAAAPAADAPGTPLTAAAALDAARAQLRDLQTRFKPDHPDVLAAQRVIRELESKVKADAKDLKDAKAAPAPAVEEVLSPAEAQRQRRVRDLHAELDVLDQQIRARAVQERRLRDQVNDYQSKLDAIPSRESDLDELTRDYRTLQETYEGLLVKREDARLNADLERRNIGQQFKVLDPARVPERPYSPKRLVVFGGGAAGGLVVALLIIGLLEYRDDSFSREDEVVRLCQLPVLALVPALTSVVERQQARRRTRMAIAASVLVVLLVCGVAAVAVWHGLLRWPGR